MGWRLASAADRLTTGWVKRFDPRFWTVDFPRPVMASVVTTAPDALRVDATFYSATDLAGLIWEAEDRWDHPLLGYETDRDFRRCTLAFRWRSGGIRALDAIDGPTLTIEGRDAAGVATSWYVRLWNYAVGTPEDARVTLDFGALEGGFLLPGEADPVYAGDIDRMFVSLVPPTYGEASGPLPAPAEGWVELTELACDGSGSVLAIGDCLVPAHGLRIATGYDDGYNLTPARMLRQMIGLGYRALINHYVGMSHHFRLEWNAGAAKFLASLAGGVLNGPCATWHADFLARAKALGFGVILSLSYELLDEHCQGDWKQRAWDGSPALTGWVPPSTLLSPAHSEAMGYLHQVAQAFAGLALAAGQAVRFQIGEPWWWVMPDGRPCLYDAAAKTALGGSPPEIGSVFAPLTPAQTALLDQAGAMLAASTGALRDAVKAVAPEAETMLLVYLPTVLDARAPELKRANVPLGWAAPAYDVLQLEDYDFVIAGNAGATARGVALMTDRLGYPPSAQHYFSGFVLNREAAPLWRGIDAAAEAGRARGAAEVFLWALPQVARDGFTHWDEEGRVDAFDEVDFPIAVGAHASVQPGFSTAIVTTAAGWEQRNADWADARMRYDAGPGVRSEADIQALIAFFRARRGAAKGFRFRDPYDDSSNGMTGEPGVADQPLGIGDGTATRFPLVKCYGTGPDADTRRITRPADGSVVVGQGGVALPGGWMLAAGGWIAPATPPVAGAILTAGFRFDVPVRFAEDRLEVSRAAFLAGEAPAVPLIEIREGGGVSLWFQQPLTTLAFCWRLDRRDGVTLGFTSHDRDLVVNGLLHRATPGMLPSAIEQSDGFDVDTLDVGGALTADAITAADLAAGRWDGARVMLSAVDWTDPASRLPLARGELGEVAQQDTGFTAELRGPTAALDAPAIEQTSPDCRAELGDRRCRVDLAARVRIATLIECVDDVTLRVDLSGATGIYGYGRLRWLDGANSGIARAILSSEADLIVLREPPPFAPAAGERVELLEGCDKAFATCGARFANQPNFQGEPHLPGNDLLTRYPGV